MVSRGMGRHTDQSFNDCSKASLGLGLVRAADHTGLRWLVQED